MKRTTSKYSIRQVSFTNLCFGVVSTGPPHLFGLCSFFVGGGLLLLLLLLLLVWFGLVCVFVCVVFCQTKHMFSPENGYVCLFVSVT